MRDWMGGLSKTAHANLKRTLEHLSQKPASEWVRPHSSSLKNHIYVIRFHDENRTQWRIFGGMAVEHGTFVLTNHGTERGGRYDPKADVCINTATSRLDLCLADWNRRTCSCLDPSPRNAGSILVDAGGLARR